MYSLLVGGYVTLMNMIPSANHSLGHLCQRHVLPFFRIMRRESKNVGLSEKMHDLM